MSRYIDANSVVDAIGLREYVLEQLTHLKETALVVCGDHTDYWDKVKTAIATQLFDADRDRALVVVNQLIHIPHYIQLWIDTAVDSRERFDFFVMTKAHDIHSMDQTKDYFWALQIRHDQLMALVQVLTLLIDRMKYWVGQKPSLLFDDSVFSGLTVTGIEDQVYLEAEKIYKERTHGGD